MPKASRASTDWLLRQQHPDGYWCGELEADSMLESDYIFMHTLLGTGDRGKMERAVNEILRHQNEDGGWSIYPGGPSNISLRREGYFALKLMGWSAEHPVLVKAREWVLAQRRRGGVQHVHQDLSVLRWGSTTTTRCRRFRRRSCCFRTGSTSTSTRSRAWSRAILVPLSIIYAKKPFKKIPAEQGIDELFVGGRENADLHLRWDKKHPFGWRNFFLCAGPPGALGGAGAYPSAAQDGAEEGREVDAGAL